MIIHDNPVVDVSWWQLTLQTLVKRDLFGAVNTDSHFHGNRENNVTLLRSLLKDSETTGMTSGENSDRLARCTVLIVH